MSEGGHKLDLVDSSGVLYQTHMPMPMMVPMQYEPGKLGNLLVYMIIFICAHTKYNSIHMCTHAHKHTHIVQYIATGYFS